MDLLHILLAVLVANLVVDGVARRSAAESWARPLLLGTIVLDALCLVPVVKTMVDLSRHKVDGLAGIVVLPGVLLGVALLRCVYQDWSLFHRPGSRQRTRPPEGLQ